MYFFLSVRVVRVVSVVSVSVGMCGETDLSREEGVVVSLSLALASCSLSLLCSLCQQHILLLIRVHQTEFALVRYLEQNGGCTLETNQNKPNRIEMKRHQVPWVDRPLVERVLPCLGYEVRSHSLRQNTTHHTTQQRYKKKEYLVLRINCISRVGT